MKFGDYLKHRRTELGWTQPDAAAKAGIEQSYLSKLETGKSIPSGDVYQRLVAAFGIETKAMTAILFPAELDRLREIESVRAVLLRQDREARSLPRRWLLGGLAMLIAGGGLVGLSRIDSGTTVRQFTYQSTGVVRPGESLDIFAGMDEEPDPATPDYAERVARRNRLIERVDDRTMSSVDIRGAAFIERVPGGRRVWRLVGSTEIQQPGRFRWAGVAGLALLFGGLGCFFISWRWPRGGSWAPQRES
jgi:transcriptional regulator with XRE-family HTH domain